MCPWAPRWSKRIVSPGIVQEPGTGRQVPTGSLQVGGIGMQRFKEVLGYYRQLLPLGRSWFGTELDDRFGHHILSPCNVGCGINWSQQADDFGFRRQGFILRQRFRDRVRLTNV